MAKNNNLTDFLTGVANAIRAKKGTTSTINPQSFESEIASLSTGKTEQEKAVTITENGTTEVSPDTGNVLSKVTVTVSVTGVEDISTSDALSAKLVAANVGRVYRFTGTTDGTYTNGDLYEVVSG